MQLEKGKNEASLMPVRIGKSSINFTNVGSIWITTSFETKNSNIDRFHLAFTLLLFSRCSLIGNIYSSLCSTQILKTIRLFSSQLSKTKQTYIFVIILLFGTQSNTFFKELLLKLFDFISFTEIGSEVIIELKSYHQA